MIPSLKGEQFTITPLTEFIQVEQQRCFRYGNLITMALQFSCVKDIPGFQVIFTDIPKTSALVEFPMVLRDTWSSTNGADLKWAYCLNVNIQAHRAIPKDSFLRCHVTYTCD